jgi:tRNA pseudouridine55 synthase
MDGLLVVDKPPGPTSHDVVARMRRALREPRIGHTGTLDPMATGVLLLVVGKATRLAKFLSASDKSYDAIVRFGFATDTADAEGRPLAAVSHAATPSYDAIDAALEAFRGTFMQQPPAFSAKKIDGQRSYTLARAAARTPSTAHPAPLTGPPALPAPARVTAHAIHIVSLDGDLVTLRVDCSAGFYVRSLAHDLGERLGIGAHLAGLCRTRIGDFGLGLAVSLDAAERDPQAAVSAMVPLADMLPALPSVVLTPEGSNRAAHGQDIRPGDQLSAVGSEASRLSSLVDVVSCGEARQAAEDATAAAISHEPFVRLLDAAGKLVGIARSGQPNGALHPSVVLV